MIKVEISKEEWQNWKTNKVTQEYLYRLHLKREFLKEGLAEGQAGEKQSQDQVIGQCQGLKDAVHYAKFEFDTIDLEKQSDD